MLPSHSRPLGPRSSSLAAADDDHDGAFQTNRLLNPHYHAADDNSPHPYTQDTEFGLLDRRHFQRSPKGSEQELPLHSARGAGAGMSNVQVHGGQAKRRGAGGVSNGINGAVASDPAGSTPAFEGHVHDHPHEQDDGRGLDKGMKGGVADAGGYATYAEARVKRSWEKQVPEYKASQNPMQLLREYADFIPLIVYTALALFTRLYRIGRSNTVVWDEAHFGKFGAYYINQTFYFDVHPPLAKMLVGLAGFLSGFDGKFDFPSGAVYPEGLPYTSMRVILALPGIALVPLAWGTALELGFSGYGRHIVTLMVLTDLAWTVISRFILLDSLLLFFTFTTVYCLACFHNQQRYPFDFEWWFWLAMTGLSIGCVASVKWIGLFVTALVGLYTVEDLWDKFGDLNMPVRVYIKHWLCRIACLIVLPFCVYLTCFKIHFLILNRSGSGDAQMSSLFQANLHGNDFANNPLEPAIGSKITLKNMGYGGGLLHSHVQTYPVGSQQQQITCYHYRDENNEWIVSPLLHERKYDPEQPLKFLQHGMNIRLVHAQTMRNLHSHDVVAPVSKLNNEISGYGNETIDDSNSYWTVEVVDDMLRGKKENFERVHALSTRIRLRHTNSGCYMRAANAVLPQWGFKQVEVSCDKQNNPRDEHTYWNIEGHTNDRLPPGDLKIMRSPFLKDFWHLNVAMMTSNNALIPDPDKEDSIASKPFDWPWLWSGMRMNGWGATSTKYYLVGNPITWWLGASSLLLYVGATAWYLARFQRKFNDFAPGQWAHYVYVGKIALGGWFLHYLPFMIMGRVTYLHHYLPTLWFAVIMAGFCLDHFVFTARRFSSRTKAIVFAVVAGLLVGTGFWMRACAWGIEGDIANYKHRLFRRSWNLVEEHPMGE